MIQRRFVQTTRWKTPGLWSRGIRFPRIRGHPDGGQANQELELRQEWRETQRRRTWSPTTRRVKILQASDRARGRERVQGRKASLIRRNLTTRIQIAVDQGGRNCQLQVSEPSDWCTGAWCGGWWWGEWVQTIGRAGSKFRGDPPLFRPKKVDPPTLSSSLT